MKKKFPIFNKCRPIPLKLMPPELQRPADSEKKDIDQPISACREILQRLINCNEHAKKDHDHRQKPREHNSKVNKEYRRDRVADGDRGRKKIQQANDAQENEWDTD